MSEFFWEKLKLYGGWIAAAVLLGVTIFISNIEIKDADLWLHIASGRHILQTLSIPKVDFLSCTIPGKIWINHEWLFQVIVASIYGVAGADGLIQMQVMVVGFTFVMLFLIGYNEKNIFFQVFILFLVLLVYQIRMTHRPDIFSLLFVILYVKSLSSLLHKKSIFPVLFILQVIWTSIHGFFILGPVIVILSLVAEFVKRKIKLPFEWNSVGRLDEIEYAHLKGCLGVILAACFVNPHFIDGVLYPLKVLFSMGGDSKVFFDNIIELEKPLNLANIRVMTHLPHYKALILISGFSFFLNRKKLDIGLFFFWLFFLIFSLSATRNIVFFSFAAYLVIMVNFMDIDVVSLIFPWGKSSTARGLVAILCTGAVIMMMMDFAKDRSTNGYYDFDKYERKNELGGVSQRNYAHKAADFLVRNNIRGNFFNDFNSGAYLLGRAHPNVKVFIDGRTEVYGSELYHKQDSIMKGDVEVFEKAVKEYGLTGVFLGSMYVAIPKKLISYLYKNDDWVLVYFDYDATVFLKNNNQNKVFIDQFAIDLSLYKTREINIVKFGARNIVPYRYMNRAEALFNMGFPRQAEAELKEVIRTAPYYRKPYPVLARIARNNKDYKKEYEYARIARILNPKNIHVSFGVAIAFYHIGELELAKERILRLEKGGYRRTELYLLLALVYAKEGEVEKSMAAFRKGKKITVDNVGYVRELGDILCSLGAYSETKEVFTKAKINQEQKDSVDLKHQNCLSDECFCF